MRKVRIYRSDKLKAREETILRVVREEIAARGFDGVTMNALAEKAGVVKKTLYNIYGGKDELLLAAVGDLVREYLDVPSGVDAGVPSIVESRRLALATVAANPSYAIAMMRSLMRVPPEHKLVDVLLRQAIEFSRDHLQVEANQGRLAGGVDCDMLARGIVAQGFGVIVLLARGLVTPAVAGEVSLSGLYSLLESHAGGELSTWLQKSRETDQNCTHSGGTRL